MKTPQQSSLPDPPAMNTPEDVAQKLPGYLRNLIRELQARERAVYQDLRLGQSRLQVLHSSTGTVASTLSKTDIGVMTVTYSAGGAKLWTTLSGKALFATLTSA